MRFCRAAPVQDVLVISKFFIYNDLASFRLLYAKGQPVSKCNYTHTPEIYGGRWILQGVAPVQDMLVRSDPRWANPAYLHWPEHQSNTGEIEV